MNAGASEDFFIGVGSNIGDRINNLINAVRFLQSEIRFSIRAISSVYETEPIGITDQPDFLNIVVWCLGEHDPVALLPLLKKGEQILGRSNRQRWGAREIDIDILMVGMRIINDKVMTIPHPEMHRRLFVLRPFAEIAPAYQHPVTGKRISEMCDQCEDHGRVVRSDSLTTLLRNTIGMEKR
jgi:2-amino-4-hydroxy-6-hydroxymethyldihydropteridine diphosphokinase